LRAVNDEELASVGVGSGVGHGEGPFAIDTRDRLVGEPIARTTGAVAGWERCGGGTSRVPGQGAGVAVGFFFGDLELSLELWNIISGISGFDD